MAGETIIMPKDNSATHQYLLTSDYNSAEIEKITDDKGKTVSVEDFSNNILNDLRKGSLSREAKEYVLWGLKSLSQRVNHARMELDYKKKKMARWNEMLIKNEDGTFSLSDEQQRWLEKRPDYCENLLAESKSKRMIKFWKDTIYSVVNVSVSTAYDGQRPLIDKIEVPHSINEVREVSQQPQQQKQNNGPGFLS